MSNLNSVSEEVFRILRSYNYEVAMYDDDGNAVFEPEDGRRFYAKKANILVSVTDENENSSVNLYLSKSSPIGTMLGLISALRTCATKYNMMFHDSRNFESDFKPKDFASKFAVREAKEDMKDLTEAMYGTSRSSYMKLENARMIVRHKTRINEESASARTRNIAKIFVENTEGERFLMPTRQLSAGRAMTQHLNHGGAFADEVGAHINRMAQDFADLGACQSYCTANAPVLAEGVAQLADKCGMSRKSITETFSRLARESSYADAASVLREEVASPVLVEDAAIQNLREMLTVEGKDLNESILEAVARYCGVQEGVLSEDDEGDEDGPKKRENWNNIEQVRVLGKVLSKNAWDDFKLGKLDLNPNPTPETHNPRFASAAAELAYKLSVVSKNCLDSSMANFLSYVGDQIADPPKRGMGLGGEQPPSMRALVMVAQQALSCAGIALRESFGLGFRGVKAIREFEEWLNTMLPDRILTEAPFPDDFRGQLPGEDGAEEDLEREMEEVVQNFNPHMFITASDLHADATQDEVRSALDHYLRDRLHDQTLVNADMSAWVDQLAPEVIQILSGMALPEGDEHLIPAGEEILDEFAPSAADPQEHIAWDISQGYTHGSDWRLEMPTRDAAILACGEDEVNRDISKQVRAGWREGSVHTSPGGSHEHFDWKIIEHPISENFDASENSPSVTKRNVGGVEYTINSDGNVVNQITQENRARGGVSEVPLNHPLARTLANQCGLRLARLGEEAGQTSGFEPNKASIAADDPRSHDSQNEEIDEDLTREDVLLPKDQGEDLKGEVLTKPKLDPRDPNPMSHPTGGDKMISELTRLAGMKR